MNTEQVTRYEKMLKHYQEYDAIKDEDMILEAILTLESYFEYKTEEELLYHNRPLAISFLALIIASRAQQERENPKPLTLEELKERVGKPVWFQYHANSFTGDSQIGWWVIIDGVHKHTISAGTPHASVMFQSISEIGIKWDMYDHELKEKG